MTKSNKIPKPQNPESDNQALQMWQTCVEMANNSSDKRMNANTVYMTIDIGLIALLTFSLDLKSIIISLVGLAVSIIWRKSIKSYRALNSAKYDVICALENKLNYKPFTQEWEQLSNKVKSGKQPKKSQYKPITGVECWVPSVFIAFFVIAVLLSIPAINSTVKSTFGIKDVVINSAIETSTNLPTNASPNEISIVDSDGDTNVGSDTNNDDASTDENIDTNINADGGIDTDVGDIDECTDKDTDVGTTGGNIS